MSRAKILSLAKYVLACSAGILWLTASSFSQSITVSPASNPPNTTTLVSGSGFSAGADVDIYFDTTDLALAVTDDTGSFSQIALRVPASALPGEHTVSAVERSTGARAQTPFRVDTRWAQFRKRPSHDGHNFGENVLSPATVGGLSLLWKYTTGNGVFSSPAVANGVAYVGSDDFNVYALNAGHRRPAVEICHRQRCGVFARGGPGGGLRRFFRRQRLCSEHQQRRPAVEIHHRR